MGVVLYAFNANVVSFGPCCDCGTPMAGAAEVYRQRATDRKLFYCINGHGQFFDAESEATKLQKIIEAKDRLISHLNERVDRVSKECEHQERRARAARGQVTKIKNRVSNGVCPCCNRSFQNLRRHMATKHPGYAHEDGLDEESKS